MKNSIIILLALLLLAGCGRQAKEGPVLARVNDYEISLEQFQQEFKESPYGAEDSVESRNEFLNSLINRKLILQEAQAKNLDKGKAFLKMIERFWEQSLLKLALETKSKEVAGSVSVDDKTVQDIYQKTLKDGKTDKSYDSAYSQIKWELTQLQESQLINEWMDQLHKKARIKIDYDLLKRDKQ